MAMSKQHPIALAWLGTHNSGWSGVVPVQIAPYHGAKMISQIAIILMLSSMCHWPKETDVSTNKGNLFPPGESSTPGPPRVENKSDLAGQVKVGL